MKRFLLLTSVLTVLQTAAIEARSVSDYIDWGATSHSFPQELKNWQPGTPLTADDNFFISRVRPRARFFNAATQVHPEITRDVDKNLIYWVPIGTPPHNGLPSDNFDSDVFSMWSYVTHFGDWSAPMARIPGSFSDAAHRNGVGVSPVLSIPWGNLGTDWAWTLRQLLDIGPEKMSEFLTYYGIDGLGYNSEFNLNTSISESRRPKNVNEISAYNAAITRLAAEKGNPAFMNIWYDGTSDYGSIRFDNGLASHNYNTFGDSENVASSLFFNYNWNNRTLLIKSVANAEAMGRSPLDLYAGFNMQGGEPRKTTNSWTLLKDYPISIGLWGAHSESMMYESRRELGASPLAIQKNYLLRTEWWFSGGSRNPASAPNISNKWNYSGENTGFFGMARLMSARSSLSEPFATNFNIGNGTFFNFKGVRQSDASWANIGIQDILPTWRYWWSSRLLGGNRSDVPAAGLDASFTWDDAWLGGSSLRITGNTDATEYLHLFKTAIEAKKGMEIYLRYKLIDGNTEMRLVLTAEGAEDTEFALPAALTRNHHASQEWREVSFGLADVAPQLIGKKISVVALKFDSASKLDMLLGGFGITDGSDVKTPATPIITTTKLLAASSDGIDGKIIWDMPDGTAKRYNDDQGVSFFQLYYQYEGANPVMQSGTSSWAGLILGAKSAAASENSKIRFGVASVGLDFITQSEIAWGEWHEYADLYELSHDVEVRLQNEPENPLVQEVSAGSEVKFSFKDAAHPAADWTLENASGTVTIDKKGESELTARLTTPGIYSLMVTYTDKSGTPVTDTYHNILSVLDNNSAVAPQITDFEYSIDDTDALICSFEAMPGEGTRSRGLVMDGRPFGVHAADLQQDGDTPWSVAFWLCPNALEEEETHLVSVRDKTEAWSKNEWGWLWSTIGKNGKGLKVNIRKSGDTGSVEYRFDDVTLTPGVWRALGFSFARNTANALDFGLFVDGVKVEPTSYKDQYGEHKGSPAPLTSLYTFSKKNIISIGGNLFKSGGVEGAIDNFTYWDKDLNEGRAALAAGDIDILTPPAGLKAFYSFEQDPEEKISFPNELAESVGLDAKAGRFQYTPQLTEGSGVAEFVAPDLCAGSPHLSSGVQMQTEVKWIAPGAQINASGTSESGQATLRYPADGVYKVILRLENPCGSDEREINMIHVPASVSVKEVATDAPSYRARVVITTDGVLVLNFESAGQYDIVATTLDGRTVKDMKVNAERGSFTINDLPAGIPLVVVVK